MGAPPAYVFVHASVSVGAIHQSQQVRGSRRRHGHVDVHEDLVRGRTPRRAVQGMDPQVERPGGRGDGEGGRRAPRRNARQHLAGVEAAFEHEVRRRRPARWDGPAQGHDVAHHRRDQALWRRWRGLAAVVRKHVPRAVGVAPRHQIGGQTTWNTTQRPSALIAGPALSASPSTPPGPTLTRAVVPVLPVVHEDVRAAVRVARHEIAGPGQERHPAAIGADRRPAAVRHSPCDAAGANAHPRRRPRLPVVHEHIDARRWCRPPRDCWPADTKATQRPSALMAGAETARRCLGAPGARRSRASSSPSAGRARTRLARRSCRPPPDCSAAELNATQRPSALIAGLAAVRVPLDAAGPDADARRRPRLLVVHEHVRQPLVSPATRLLASDSNATQRPSALIAAPPLSTIRLGAAGPDAHARRRPGLPVVHEDVPLVVRVARHQIAGAGGERHPAAIGADRRAIAGAIRLGAPGPDAHSRRRAESAGRGRRHRPTGVRVARHQIAGPGLERHPPAISADRRPGAAAIRLGAPRPHTHPRRRGLRQHRPGQQQTQHDREPPATDDARAHIASRRRVRTPAGRWSDLRATRQPRLAGHSSCGRRNQPAIFHGGAGIPRR